MSKERLEEAKKLIKHYHEQKRSNNVMLTERGVELIEHLYEQAERAQELEELIEDYKTVNKELHDRRKKLRKQNKRYREAIANIKQTSKDFRNGHLLDIQDSFFVDEIIAIINKLEGDSDE